METINIASLPIKAHELVVDIGCGEGRHCIALNYYFPTAHVIGLDLSKKDLLSALNKHKDFVEDKLTQCTYMQSNAFNLPFSDNSVDHIICSEVFEHLHEYQDALNEIQRCLKPGGSFVISVPRAWPEKICWYLSSAYHQVEGGHVRIFNSKKLQEEIQEKQFKFSHRHWAHALHVPYWWLHCLFWRPENPALITRLYHKLLVWDLMSRPLFTRTLERLLNPIMGKSVVLYFTKSIQS